MSVYIYSSKKELYHHGIKGQKWGVRRYQNPDGSLTEAGRKRYAKALKSLMSRPEVVNKESYSGIDDHINRYKRKNNTKAVKILTDIQLAQKTGVIPKGFELYRSTTNSKETIDSNRKYVSMNPEGALEYLNPEFLTGFGENGEGPRLKVYKTKKDLKLASSDELSDYVAKKNLSTEDLTKYSNLKRDAKALLSQYKDVSLTALFDVQNTNSIEDKVLSYLSLPYSVNAKMSSKYIFNTDPNLYDRYKRSNDTIDHFKKLGYDAIPDMEDNAYGDHYAAPIILLNPEKSIEEVERSNEDDYDYLLRKLGRK